MTSRLFPEWDFIYDALEEALHEIMPDTEIPAKLYPLRHAERGHIASDLPLRISKTAHLPLETVHAKLGEVLKEPSGMHAAYIEGFVNFRFTDVSISPVLPVQAAPDNPGTVIIAIIPPRGSARSFTTLRLAARGLLQAGIASALGYQVKLFGGRNHKAGSLTDIWHTLVEQDIPSVAAETVIGNLTPLINNGCNGSVWLTPRTFKGRDFKNLSAKLFHSASRISMCCPSQRWCGEGTVAADLKFPLTVEALWYFAGYQPAQSCEASIPAFKERDNRLWFYSSLLERLKELMPDSSGYSDAAVAFEGINRTRLLLPAFLRALAARGAMEDCLMAYDCCIDQFLTVFHSPETRRRLHENQLSEAESHILSGVRYYLSDILEHNSRLIEGSFELQPLYE